MTTVNLANVSSSDITKLNALCLEMNRLKDEVTRVTVLTGVAVIAAITSNQFTEGTVMDVRKIQAAYEAMGANFKAQADLIQSWLDMEGK